MARAWSPGETLGFSRSGRRRFRFPCGHLVPEAVLSMRLRTAARGVWAPCVACNVAVVVVGRLERGRDPGRGQHGERGGPRS